MNPFENIDDINRWLTQTNKRDKAERKIEKIFRRTGQVKLPDASEWQQFPCDVCARIVGETGHIQVNVLTSETPKMKDAYLRVRCAACHDYFANKPMSEGGDISSFEQ